MAEYCNAELVVHRALYKALETDDAPGLLALVTSTEREHWPSDWCIANTAARYGAARCLHILKERGFELNTATWGQAALSGHVNCLAYAVAHGFPLEDRVFTWSVVYGQLACVDLLLQHGLPRKPHMHFRGSVNSEQMMCYELMADRKVHIHPETSIVAAESGDVDFLRWLHKCGVPLWQHALEVGGPYDACGWESCLYEVKPLTFYMSRFLTDLKRIWKALRYGSLHGAPVTPRAQALLTGKRERTHAVLFCCKAAVRLSQGPAASKKRRAWASMDALPLEIMQEILILADLEIKECFMLRP